MLHRPKENKKSSNFDASIAASQYRSQNCGIWPLLAQNQINIASTSGNSLKKSFKSSIFLDSQHGSTQNYSEVVSLQQNIMEEHLICLESTINKISEKLFKITFDCDRIELYCESYHQSQSTLKQYLTEGKSMIPHQYVQPFLQFFQKNANFKRVLNWIYDHVQPHLGDELILACHKILFAYLPIKNSLSNVQEIAYLSQYPFNLHNIFNDHRFKLINISNLYQLKEGIVWYDLHFLQFYQQFLQTMLLVLEQYFENPGYLKALQQKQKRQNRTIESKVTKKHQKVKKIKKKSGKQ